MSPDEERIPTTMPIQEVEVGVPSSPKIVEPEICEMKQRKGGHANEEESLEVGVDKPVEYVPALKWPDLLAQIFIHVGFVYGFGLIFTKAKLLTSLWALFLIIMSGFGITAGAHRLWSHRAYKAEWPLRLILVFLFTIAGQRHVYAWALDHRVHHKYSETDADPHNAKRGFFFAHVGWLFTTPHPDVVAKRKAVDMSDLEADPIVMWQKRSDRISIRVEFSMVSNPQQCSIVPTAPQALLPMTKMLEIIFNNQLYDQQ